MRRPIQTEKAEELILYYAELHYRWINGWVDKVKHNLTMKARELGFGISSAFSLIRYARDIGMIDGEV